VSTSQASESDPYLLPLPSPASLVVLPHYVNPLHAHLNARYGDPVWPLAALTENPSVSKKTIYWRRCPAVFREEIRLAAWNLINGQLRPTYLRDCGTRLRARISLGEIVHAISG
jgi:hypothetical protein